MYNIRQRLINFFNGRYGFDALNTFLLIMSFFLVRLPYVFILSYIFLIFAVYRMLSRDIYKRQQELNWYNKYIGYKLNKFLMSFSQRLLRFSFRVKARYDKFRIRQEEKKHYVFFKCKSCRKTLRVPKGKGKIKTTCPVCKYESIRRT